MLWDQPHSEVGSATLQTWDSSVYLYGRWYLPHHSSIRKKTSWFMPKAAGRSAYPNTYQVL